VGYESEQGAAEMDGAGTALTTGQVTKAEDRKETPETVGDPNTGPDSKDPRRPALLQRKCRDY
jgi:hypothetical protein